MMVDIVNQIILQYMWMSLQKRLNFFMPNIMYFREMGDVTIIRK